MYSKELANIMKSYLDSYELKYNFDENDGAFTFATKLSGKIRRVIFSIIVGYSSYYIIGFLDAPDFDDTLIPSVSEFLHRVNFLCHESRFELDADGKIVCCTQCINCKGVTPNDELITYSISDILYCIKKYGKGLVDVIKRKGTPQKICYNYQKEFLS